MVVTLESVSREIHKLSERRFNNFLKGDGGSPNLTLALADLYETKRILIAKLEARSPGAYAWRGVT